MLMFREEKSPEDEIKAWQFWHSRQHSVKQRILDAGKYPPLHTHQTHSLRRLHAPPIYCSRHVFGFVFISNVAPRSQATRKAAHHPRRAKIVGTDKCVNNNRAHETHRAGGRDVTEFIK